MNIRLAMDSDKQAVLELVSEFNSMLKPNEKLPITSAEIYDEIIRREDTHVFVALDDDKAVGYATLFLIPNLRHGWHRGHIEDFFVTSRLRGKGVGKLLFAAVVDFARGNGIKVIKLDSGNELTDAHAFYEKLGGKTTERFFRFDI